VQGEFGIVRDLTFLASELCAHHTVQRTRNLNGHSLICVFLSESSHSPSIIVVFQRDNKVTTVGLK
jgi:hypothetical protein